MPDVIPPRRAVVSLSRIAQVCQIFEIDQLPTELPYATPVGLDLPTRVPREVIQVIAAGAAAPVLSNSPWHLGDLLSYLQDAEPLRDLYDWTRDKLAAAGLKDQTQFNYKSVSRSFALDERMTEVSWFAHSLLRAISKKDRPLLLRRVANQHMTIEQIKRMIRARGLSRREQLASQLIDSGHRILRKNISMALLRKELEHIKVLTKQLGEFTQP